MSTTNTFPFAIVRKSDGSPSKKLTMAAIEKQYDEHVAVLSQDADAIRDHVDALYASLPAGTPILVKALRTAILNRMGADLTNFKSMEERLDANLGDYVVTSKNGAVRATPEQVQVARAAREASKAKRDAAKAASTPTV